MILIADYQVSRISKIPMLQTNAPELMPAPNSSCCLLHANATLCINRVFQGVGTRFNTARRAHDSPHC